MLKIQFNANFNRTALAPLLDFKNACLAQATVSPALARLSRKRYTDKVYASKLDISTQDRLVLDFHALTTHLI